MFVVPPTNQPSLICGEKDKVIGQSHFEQWRCTEYTMNITTVTGLGCFDLLLCRTTLRREIAVLYPASALEPEETGDQSACQDRRLLL